MFIPAPGLFDRYVAVGAVFLAIRVGNERLLAAGKFLLLDSPLLLDELVAEHGQFGFRARDGFLVILNASTCQTEGGLGFLDLLIAGSAYCARNCFFQR